MGQGRRSNIAIGIVMLIIGVVFLVIQLVPSINEWYEENVEFSWPVIIISVGLLLFVMGLFFRAPGMAVPACIVGGIGGILYWQNATGNWESWSYAWTLIPGFVGVGVLLSGLLGGDFRKQARGGIELILISLAMFFIFGSIFGDIFEEWGLTGQWWPLVFIFFGIWILLRGIFRKR